MGASPAGSSSMCRWAGSTSPNHVPWGGVFHIPLISDSEPEGWNEVENYFHEVDENTTKWVSENEFRCSGFMKLFALLLPGSFKKETMQYLKYLKEFAEKEGK